MDDESFVRATYQTILQREVDEPGLRDWLAFLDAGRWRKELVSLLVAGEEFRTLGTEPLQARFHRARQSWIATLPAAQRIVDIGGSSPTCPEGALHEMGWNGRPDHLTIVDLPPEDQYHGRPAYSQAAPHATPWGGEVVYLHARAEHLPAADPLPGVRFDGVFMGQAFEHIEAVAMPALLSWIVEHLEPGGWFAFDTPNRAVTEIQCGAAFSDPDHTKEYFVHEAADLLARAGLLVTSRAGIMPCADVIRRGVWDPVETYRGPLVDGVAETGWAFALVAVRPG